MDNNTNTVQENVLAGPVGALLFSLVGGILWFLLYQVGFFAGISGLAGVVCAIKGYSIFAKKESMKGIIISVAASVVVMVLAWYLCLSLDLVNAYQEWYNAGEIDYTITFPEAVSNAYLFLSEPEIAGAYIKDLVIGLALCAVGAFSFVKYSINKVRLEKRSNVNGSVVEDNIVDDNDNDEI